MIELDDVRSVLSAYPTSDGYVEAVHRLLESLEDPWEPWRPASWMALSDALEGWQLGEPMATQTDEPYNGPDGLAIAGSAADHVLCLIVVDGRVSSTVMEWDQTMGRFVGFASL